MTKRAGFLRRSNKRGVSKKTLTALSLLSLFAQCSAAEAQVHTGGATRPGSKDNTPLISGENLTGSQIAQQLNSGSKYFKLQTTTPIVGDLVIPKGVTLVNMVAASTSILNVTGNLIDSGKLVFRASSPLIDQANLAASNVVVNPGALISSLNNLNLNIHALNNIVNAGTISSAANLNLTAGGSIVNALPAGVTGAAPLMQAAQNLNLITGSGIITNSGVISAMSGNVNIAAVTASQSLKIDNVLGSIQAANAINVRDALYTGFGNLNLSGGDLISQTLNLNSGKGTVDVIANNITGVINVSACNAHIGALASPELKLGVLNVSDDPTYFNTGGDVSINSNISTNGTDLAILASGNVSINKATIDTSGAGNAGNLLIVAGAELSGAASGQVDNDTTTNITIANGAGSGGGSKSGGNVLIDSASSISTKGSSNGNGGSVQIFAYSGDTNAGSVQVNNSIQTGGNGTGKNGNVTIIAPGAANGDAINVSSISTQGSTALSATGTITLTAGSPTITGGNISVLNGTPSGGTFIAGSIGAGNIVTNGALSTNGSGVQLATAGKIIVGGNVQTDAEASQFNQNAGAIALLAGGDISASGKTQLAFTSTSFNSGADMTLLAGVALSADNTSASKVIATGASSTGGNIDFGNANGGPGATFNTATGKATFGNSGNFRAMAFNGGIGNKGHIELLTGATSVNTGSPSNQDFSGSINLIAGANSGVGISSGNLDSRQGNGNPNSGTINLQTATPQITASITFTNGKPGASSYSVGTTQASSIVVGSITSPGGSITVNSGTSTTLNGSINVLPIAPFSAPNVTLTSVGALTVLGGSSGQIKVNGALSGSNPSGIINVSASNIVVSGTGPWLVNADAQAGTANGGKVTITQTGSGGLTIGTSTTGNNIQVSAIGGTTGGNGGIVNLNSGGNLVVDPVAVTASPAGVGTGKGAQFAFSAGTAGSGNLNISGSLNANSTNTGDGGSISLTSNSSSAFLVNGNKVNFVNGTLSANAGTAGNAGSISIFNNGTGGVTLSNPADVTATAGIGGNGAKIDIESAGPVTIGSGLLSADPQGAGAGGSIVLIGSSVLLPTTGGGLLASTGSGTITVRALTAANTNINTINFLSAKSIELISDSGSFTLGANTINASSSAALVTKSNITSLTGIASVPNLTLVSTGGNIGVDGDTGRLSVSAANVTLKAFGSVWVTDSSAGDGNGDINFQDSVVAGTPYVNGAANTFSFFASGISPGKSIKSAGGVAILANDLDISSTGGLSLAGAITVTNTAAFISNDSILSSSVASLSSNAVVLFATGTGASIGADVNNRVTVKASTVTASATDGSVFLKVNSTGDVSGNINLVNAKVGSNQITNSAKDTFSLFAIGISSGNVLASAGVSASDIVITSTGGIAGTLTGGNSVALISTNSLSSSVSVSAPNVVLAATGTLSSIGTDSGVGRFKVSGATNLTLNAPGFASVWVTDTASGSVNLVDATVEGSSFTNKAGQTFSLVANIPSGSSLVTKAGVGVTATDIDLSSSGGIALAGNTVGTSSVALVSNDSILTLTGVTAPILLLAATGSSSSVGTSSLSRLTVNAESITLSAPAGVFVRDTSAGDLFGNINLVNATVNGTKYTNSSNGVYSLVADGIGIGNIDINAGSTVSGDSVNFTSTGGIANSGTITATTNAAFVSNNSITSIGSVSSSSLTLAATGVGSKIGVDANNRLTVSAATLTAFGNAVFITNTSKGDSNGNVTLTSASVNGVLYDNATGAGAFSINANGIASGKNLIVASGKFVNSPFEIVLKSSGGVSIQGILSASDISLISSDSINNSSLTGLLGCTHLTLVATGSKSSIGSSASPLQLNHSGLTAQALNGSVFIDDSTTGDGSGNLNLLNATVEGVSYENKAGTTWSLFANNIAAGKSVVSASGVNITAPAVQLYSGGGYKLAGNIVASTSAAITCDDSILASSLTGKVTTPSLTLYVYDSTSDIGTSSASRLTVDAASLSLFGRNVWVSDVSAGDANGNVNLINGTAFGSSSFVNSATATYSLIVSGIASGHSVKSAAGVNVNGAAVELQSSGGFSMSGDITATASIALVALDSIPSLGNVSAPVVVLAVTGSGSTVGKSGAPLSIDAGSFTFSAPNGGSVLVNNVSTGVIAAVDSSAFGSPYTNTAGNTYQLAAGSATIVSITGADVSAANVNLASGGDMDVTGAHIKANNIDLAAGNTLTITDNAITAQSNAVDGSGGSVTVSAGSIVGALNSTITLTANGKDNSSSPAGGFVNVTQASSFSVGSGKGEFTLAANAGQGVSDIAKGGNIALAVSGGTANSITIDPAFMSLKSGKAGGSGGSLSLISTGAIVFPTSSSIDVSASGTGSFSGGTVLMSADKITFNAAQKLSISANAASSGDGGSIQVSSTGAASSLSVGNSAGQFSLSAKAGSTSGNGGSVQVVSGGSLVFSSVGVSVDASAGGGNGGSVSMTATGALTLSESSYNYDGVGNGSGGFVHFEGGSISSSNLTISARSGTSGSGSGGAIEYKVNGSSDIAIDTPTGLNLIASGGSVASITGAGGRVSVTTAGKISVNPAAIKVAPLGTNGNGGTIQLSGSTISKVGGGRLDLSVAGVGAGNGGTLTLTQSTTSAQSVGSSASSNFSLNANAGSGGGIGGTIEINTGGNLTVDPAGLSILASSPNTTELASGGTLILASGANLFISGNLSASSAGKNASSIGGSITLQSKSATAFLIGNGTINGIKGTLSVNGVSNNGTINVSNKGGGVSDNQASMNAQFILLSTGNNGNLLINGALGGASTQQVTLHSNGKGTVTSAQSIQSAVVRVTGDSGNVSLTKLNVSKATDISVENSASSNITITGVIDKSQTASTLTVSGISIGNLVNVSTVGNLAVGNVVGNVVTLKSTGTTNQTLSVSAPVSATTGDIILSAPGNITLSGNLNAAGSVKVNTSSGDISSSAPMKAGAKGSVALVATKGSISASDDLSAGVKVSLSALKGSVTLASVGQNASTPALEVNSLNSIVNNGLITVTNTVSEKTTGTNASITVNEDMLVTAAAGTLLLNTSGSGSDINTAVNHDLSAGKSISIIASKGNLGIDSNLGSNSSTLSTATLTGLGVVTVNGSISGLSTTKVGITATATTGDVNIGSGVDLSAGGVIYAISGADVSLNVSSNIGSNTVPLALSAKTSLTVVSPSLVNLKNTAAASPAAPFTLNSSSAGSSFKLLATGSFVSKGVSSPTVDLTGANITLDGNVGGVGSTSVSLTATGTGSITNKSGVISVDSSKGAVTLNSGSGAIGGSSAIQVNTPVLNIASLGDVKVNNSGAAALTVNTPTSTSKSFTVSSNGAMVIASNVPNASSIILSTVNGNITLQGNLGKSSTTSINLSAGGSGAIVQNGKTIQAVGVVLASNSTDIGTVGTPFVVAASKTIQVNAGGTGNVILVNSGTAPLTLNTSSAGASFDFSTASNLTAGAVSAGSGSSIKLTTTGTNHSILIAGAVGNAGVNSIELTATGTGTITKSGAAAILHSDSVSLKSGSGNIGTATGGVLIEDAATLVVSTGGKALVNVTGTVDLTSNNLTVSALSTFGTGAVTISSQAGLTVPGISTAGNITLSTTNNGALTVSGNLTSTAAAGVISLLAEDAGTITQSGVSLFKAATINMKTGANGTIGTNLKSLQIDATNISASSTGTGLVNLTNNRSTATTLNSSSSGSGGFVLNTASLVTTIKGISTAPGDITLSASNGSFVMGGTVGSPSANSINITATNGSITQSGSSAIQGASVNLSVSGASSSVGTAAAVNVNTPSLAASTSPSGTGSVNLNNTFTGASVLSNSNAAAAFTLKSAGTSTSLNSILAGNGSVAGNIAITAAKGTLQTLPGAVLASTGGFLTLTNSDKTAGNIIIGAGSQLSTSGPSGKNVSILIGSTTTTVGPVPTNVNYTVDGKPVSSGSLPPNTFIFGSNGINVTNQSTVDMNVLGGAKVIFNTGTRPASAITVDGSGTTTHTVITADPPVVVAPGSTAASHAIVPSLKSNALSLSSVVQPSAVVQGSPQSNNLKFTTFNTALPMSQVQSGLWSAASLRDMTPISSTASSRFETDVVEANVGAVPSYFDDVIPAVVYSDTELGISSGLSSELQHVHATVLKAGQSALEASLSRNEGVRAIKVKDACALIAPQFDSVVETKFGRVNIDAGALVLLIQNANGLAIYDLDDAHGKSVSLTQNGQTLHLYPGLGVLLSNSSRATFEESNAAQAFCYRDIKSHAFGAGLKVFSAEFSIPSAIRSVAPLKQLFASKQQSAKRVSSHLLKTVAASQQTRKGDRFQPALKNTKTAFLH